MMTKTLTKEEIESIKVLQTSPHWGVYRDLIRYWIDSDVSNLSKMDEPIKISRLAGRIEGMKSILDGMNALTMERKKPNPVVQDEASAD